jgi:hypothetical protein
MKKPPFGGFSLCWQRTRFKRRKLESLRAVA